jgi:hypothetical protein
VCCLCVCRSPAGEDVVPTFTTSNDRMLLALADGTSGMLRVEDAERLQVGACGGSALRRQWGTAARQQQGAR